MDRSKVPAVLSIAGSDSSGGAGIQADIKTITAHRLYAETAITAITAQNTLGVTAVQDISPDIVAAQIDAVFDDIRPSAVKIGMVSSAEIIEVIADRLSAWDAQNIVVDPVMVATSGARLIAEDASEALTRRLFPLATVITSNIPEAMALLDYEVRIPKGGRTDALTECIITWSEDGGAVRTRGIHTNQVFAGITATLRLVNLLIHRSPEVVAALGEGTGAEE